MFFGWCAAKVSATHMYDRMGANSFVVIRMFRRLQPRRFMASKWNLGPGVDRLGRCPPNCCVAYIPSVPPNTAAACWRNRPTHRHRPLPPPRGRNQWPRLHPGKYRLPRRRGHPPSVGQHCTAAVRSVGSFVTMVWVPNWSSTAVTCNSFPRVCAVQTSPRIHHRSPWWSVVIVTQFVTH